MLIFRKIWQRFRIFGLIPTLEYLFFTVFLEKIDFHIDIVYSIQPESIQTVKLQGFSFRLIHSVTDISDSDTQALKEYGGIELVNGFSTSLAEGEICALGYFGQELGCVCWARAIDGHDLTGRQDGFIIWRCFTLPRLRGHGMYPKTLKFLCYKLNEMSSIPILIECSLFNHASIKGIEKAGFKFIGKVLRFRKWSKPYSVARS